MNAAGTVSYALHRIFLLGILALPFFAASVASAHTSLEKFIRLEASITVRSSNVDVRLRYFFPTAPSQVERESMDTNHDGRITEAEREGYVNQIRTLLERNLHLAINGTDAMVIPLEDPVLDLQDEPGVQAHPHELSLAFFARLPEDFGVDGTLVLDTEMWTDRPLMLSVTVDGEKGMRFARKEAKGLRYPLKDETKCRLAEVRCTRWKLESSNKGRSSR